MRIAKASGEGSQVGSAEGAADDIGSGGPPLGLSLLWKESFNCKPLELLAAVCRVADTCHEAPAQKSCLHLRRLP